MLTRVSNSFRIRSTAAIVVAAVVIAGCDSSIYVRDGVTDGDTFYVPPDAAVDDNPVIQSWIAYGLSRSTCKLSLGGDNPARNTSYACELGARELLVETWLERREAFEDEYLDLLLDVAEDGFLDEYTWFYLQRRDWERPPGLDMERFAAYRDRYLRGHEPVTRIIGSWNYADR